MLAATVLTACSGGDAPPDRPDPLAGLTRAVSAVNAQRAGVLAAVDAVQAAAAAVDDADAVCATGKGVAARDALRAAEPLVAKARTGLQRLPTLTAGYRTALDALGTQVTAVTGAQRKAVENVVRTGRAEALAATELRDAAVRAWPAYDVQLELERTWVKRAVTPWYRTAQEGASAYAILVEPTRSRLAQARESLGTAASDAVDASRAQSATLSAANTALASLRPTP